MFTNVDIISNNVFTLQYTCVYGKTSSTMQITIQLCWILIGMNITIAESLCVKVRSEEDQLMARERENLISFPEIPSIIAHSQTNVSVEKNIDEKKNVYTGVIYYLYTNDGVRNEALIRSL